MVYKKEISAELEKSLEEFDKIILVDANQADPEAVEELYGAEDFKKSPSGILILSAREDKQQENVTERHSPACELQEFLKLYRMYEFSDRVSLFSQEDSYGGLYNYVKTGVLTVEEAINVFLQFP